MGVFQVPGDWGGGVLHHHSPNVPPLLQACLWADRPSLSGLCSNVISSGTCGSSPSQYNGLLPLAPASLTFSDVPAGSAQEVMWPKGKHVGSGHMERASMLSLH